MSSFNMVACIKTRGTLHSIPSAIMILVIYYFNYIQHTFAFYTASTTATKQLQERRQPQQLTSTIIQLYSSSSTSTSTRQDEPALSETDARVLRQMLQDENKLDLETEENMKKLLERGVVSKDTPDVPKSKREHQDDDDDSKSEFSSEALKTLSDTKMWKAVSRKAGDFLESVKLAVMNKVERDAMTLAALGVFAWERAVRDAARALPASTSSTTQIDNAPLLLSNKSSAKDSMTTPMDEIKSVTTAVADILKTGCGATRSGGDGATGVLRNAAAKRASNAQTFQRTYQQAKAKEARSKDPTRAAAGVVDTAWQLKRELQVEQNVPGYKTDKVKKQLGAAKDSTQQLLQGARNAWNLEREKTNRLLSQTASKEREENNGIMDTAASVNKNEEISAQQLQQQRQIQEEARQRQERLEVERRFQQELQEKQQLQQEQTRQQVMDDLVAQKKLWRAQKREQTKQLQLLENLLLQECTRLQHQLQNCIVNPEQTWLRAEIIEGILEFDQDLIRQVVTEMIATRNSIKELVQAKEFKTLSNEQRIDQILYELRVDVQAKLAELARDAECAVSEGAARALTKELVEGSKEEHTVENNVVQAIPVLLRLEELQQHFEELLDVGEEPTGNETKKAENWGFFSYFTNPVADSDNLSEPYAGTMESEVDIDEGIDVVVGQAKDATESEIVDVIPEAFVYAVATTPVASVSERAREADDGISNAAAAAADAFASSVVELVSDDDFEEAVGETKQAVAVFDDDNEAIEGTGNEKPNVIFTLLLRSLDIMFFLLEKTLIAVPTVISTTSLALERMDKINKGGLGSEGWQVIDSAQRGAQRY